MGGTVGAVVPMSDQSPRTLLGAVEAGGTKVNLAVGTGSGAILRSARIETTNPEQTLAGMLDFFEPDRARIAFFGVASFGPVRLDRAAPDWGRLLGTPKPGWSGASFVHPLIKRFAQPVALDTDVNAAALSEHLLGALRGVRCGAYVTVGTGVGAGFVIDGVPVHGTLHPEVGHVRVVRGSGDEGFAGTCPYHGDCLEGLASGPAIERRWGASLSDLPAEHVADAMVADYLGQACANLALTLSVGRIVIGGGVSKTPGLHAAVSARMRHWLGGYLPDSAAAAEDFVVEPGLLDRAGLMGAMLLAEREAPTDDATA